MIVRHIYSVNELIWLRNTRQSRLEHGPSLTFEARITDMARILVDANGLQARQHLDAVNRGSTKGRLTTFLDAIGAFGTIGFSSDAGISGAELSSANLLIITTRPQQSPYSAAEIRTIHDFVAGGGSLLLMTNHSRIASKPSGPSFTEQDGRLADVFGVRLLDVCFQSPIPGELTSLQFAGNESHPILLDPSGSRTVHFVEINNCSAVSHSSERGQPMDAYWEGHRGPASRGRNPRQDPLTRTRQHGLLLERTRTRPE